MLAGCGPTEMGMLNIYKIPGYRGICSVDPKEMTKYLVSQATEKNRDTQDPNDVKYQDFQLDVETGPQILKDAITDIVLQFGHTCGCRVDFLSAWTICHKREHQTYPHNHIRDPFNFACVYWAQVPEGAGLLEMYPLSIADGSVDITPVEGHFLIFPGDLIHGVRQNMSDELRVSMSCNLYMDVDNKLSEKETEISRRAYEASGVDDLIDR